MGLTAYVVIFLMVSLAIALIVLVVFLHKRTALLEERNFLEEEHRLLDEKYQKIVNRFRPVVNLFEEAEKLRAEIQQLQAEHLAFVATATNQRQLLAAEYQQSKALYDRVRREVSLLEENLEDISFGLYKPHYEFATSEDFRKRLDEIRDQKKARLRSDQATKCLVEWNVG